MRLLKGVPRVNIVIEEVKVVAHSHTNFVGNVFGVKGA